MQINKIACGQCSGRGRTTVWKVDEADQLIRRTEVACQQCAGKGYITYPVFNIEEAIEIAKHFGFEVIGEYVYE